MISSPLNPATQILPFGLSYQQRLYSFLQKILPSDQTPPFRLHQAMTYSILGSGKCLRPILTYSVGQVFSVPLEILDYSAAAIEMVHAFSLIHDDLPAIDNDNLRRGKPSCHRAYDEATAILAGDALYGLAFQTLAQIPQVSAQSRLDMIQLLAQFSGTTGMIGGEMRDIEAEQKVLDIDELLQISEWKTARLIQCALLLPTYITAHCSTALREQLQQYGLCMGIAFQIQDDILDATGQHKYLGKEKDGDRRQKKATLPLLTGITMAQQIRNQYYERACKILNAISLPLQDLHQFLGKLVHKE